MRADRLLSILMILQSHGRTTAAKLAAELEVTPRTIYRDLDALSAAGVPVYADRGPGGGCSLDPNYRTTLTGLTEDEVQALFAINIPAPLERLGIGVELKAALRKLLAALPSRQNPKTLTRQRFYLDSIPWSLEEEPVPFLPIIQQAVWQGRQIDLAYYGEFDTRIERRLSPYGLIVKANLWYLVGVVGEEFRVIRISRVADVRICEELVSYPPDFSLTDFWQEWCHRIDRERPEFQVRTRIAPALIPLLPRLFGPGIHDRIEQADPPDCDGWIRLTLTFETFFAARARLLGLGQAVEILEPRALRLSVQDLAEQIVNLYKDRTVSKIDRDHS
jgi:predicted DNA-binding transcriptional regulator YafY